MFVEKFKDNILGTNSYFDRLIITGSLLPISFCNGLQSFLSTNNILLKNFIPYAEKLQLLLKESAKSIAEAENAHYQYLNSPSISKEKLVKKVIKKRGNHPGLVAVLTTLEVDNSYSIHKNRIKKKLELIHHLRKCLHIYYYFIDEHLGLCHFRLQTFFPFKIQIYFNGREQLVQKLDQCQILYEKDDNCFTYFSDISKAQQLADDLDVSKLQTLFDQWAEKYVVILPLLRKHWQLSYHWSLKQVEYAKDILFQSQQELDSIYNQLLQYMIISALPTDVLSFLGKKRSGKQSNKVETDIRKSYLGYRIKHKNGFVSIKMYNKAGSVLRIEITINNVSKIKVYRDVEQRNGETVHKLAPMKKSIYSMEHVIRYSQAAISRYLDFLAKMNSTDKGNKQLRQLTERKTEKNRNYKGFNPFNSEESSIFETLIDGRFITFGFTNKELRLSLAQRNESLNYNSSKISRLLKRLRVFGLAKRIQKSYKYFLTEKGRLIFTMCVKLKNMVTIPTMNALIDSMACKTD